MGLVAKASPGMETAAGDPGFGIVVRGYGKDSKKRTYTTRKSARVTAATNTARDT